MYIKCIFEPDSDTKPKMAKKVHMGGLIGVPHYRKIQLKALSFLWELPNWNYKYSQRANLLVCLFTWSTFLHGCHLFLSFFIYLFIFILQKLGKIKMSCVTKVFPLYFYKVGFPFTSLWKYRVFFTSSPLPIQIDFHGSFLMHLCDPRIFVIM